MTNRIRVVVVYFLKCCAEKLLKKELYDEVTGHTVLSFYQFEFFHRLRHLRDDRHNVVLL